MVTTDQQPPAFSRRSNNLILSNSFSWDRASIVMAPAGPAPITAIDLNVVMIFGSGTLLGIIRN